MSNDLEAPKTTRQLVLDELFNGPAVDPGGHATEVLVSRIHENTGRALQLRDVSSVLKRMEDQWGEIVRTRCSGAKGKKNRLTSRIELTGLLGNTTPGRPPTLDLADDTVQTETTVQNASSDELDYSELAAAVLRAALDAIAEKDTQDDVLASLRGQLESYESKNREMADTITRLDMKLASANARIRELETNHVAAKVAPSDKGCSQRLRAQAQG
jgi:chromosome segregation ATPase